MKSFIVFSAIVFSVSSVMAAPLETTKVKCTAEFRKILPSGQVDAKSTELKAVFNDDNFYKVETDLGEMSYSVIFEKGTDKALASVTLAPDYVRGSVTNSSFNQEGRLTTSLVDGNTVGKIVCVKN